MFDKSRFYRLLRPKFLAVTALGFWVCSLPLTGLALYPGNKFISGVEILSIGWLGPLMLNFTWYANVFFIFGALSILSGGKASKSSVIAIALSLTTFGLSRYPQYAGSDTAVYGYGWGAVLWLIAIILLRVAEEQRAYSVCNSSSVSRSDKIKRCLGLFMLAVVVTAIGGLAMRDRALANDAESQKLKVLALKRGAVCRHDVQAPKQPISNFSGALELVMYDNIGPGRYPFRQVKTLLEWGIPTIRIGNSDYSMNRDSVISVARSAGKPSAVLYVNEKKNLDRLVAQIEAKLVETDSGRVVFDQVWEREGLPVNHDHYCPDYKSFPSPDEQPRALLMQALNLPAKNSTQNVGNSGTKKVLSGLGTIMRRGEGGYTAPDRIRKWNARNPDKPFGFIEDLYNTGCKDGFGVAKEMTDPFFGSVRPFVVDDKSYFMATKERRNATCIGDWVYLYKGVSGEKGYSLTIDKHSLQDFHQTWTTSILIEGTPAETRDDVLKVMSISEDNNGMTIELSDDNSGKTFLVRSRALAN